MSRNQTYDLTTRVSLYDLRGRQGVKYHVINHSFLLSCNKPIFSANEEFNKDNLYVVPVLLPARLGRTSFPFRSSAFYLFMYVCVYFVNSLQDMWVALPG